MQAATIPFFIMSLVISSSLTIGDSAPKMRGERGSPFRGQVTPDLELASARAQQQVQIASVPPLVEAQPRQPELVSPDTPGVARFHDEPAVGERDALVVGGVAAVQVERRRESEHLDSRERQD